VNPTLGTGTAFNGRWRSLKRMGVDRLDAVHIHNLGDFDARPVVFGRRSGGGSENAERRLLSSSG